MAYPTIFDLLKYKGNLPTTENMTTLTYQPTKERTYLLIILNVPPHHLQVLWIIEKYPLSYAKKTVLDGQIVAFSRDVVSGATPPTVTINPNWWDIEDHPDVLPGTAATGVAKLVPTEVSIARLTYGYPS